MLDLVALILLVFLLLKKVLSGSSYGHFTAAKEFRSQCHIFHGYYSKKKKVPGVQYPVGPGGDRSWYWEGRNLGAGVGGRGRLAPYINRYIYTTHLAFQIH